MTSYYKAQSERSDEAERLLIPPFEHRLSPSEAAATLGAIKTKKKAKASRENGRKGGRPKGNLES